MKETTFSILDGEKTVIKEKFFDDNSNLIHVIDHTMRPHEELKFTYNDKNELIRKVMIIDGMECDALEMEYNSDGEISQQRHFINGEIYDELTLVKTENGWTRTELQDGEEAERTESKTIDGVETIHYYEFGELVQTDTITKIDQVVTTIISMPGSDDKYTRIETLNEVGKTLEICSYSTNGEIESSYNQIYDGKSLQKIVYKNHNGSEASYEQLLSYDESGNRIKMEHLDENGRLLQYEKSLFNEKNQVIERAGYNGSKKYHFLFEYAV